jgi:hypothetical protein
VGDRVPATHLEAPPRSRPAQTACPVTEWKTMYEFVTNSYMESSGVQGAPSQNASRFLLEIFSESELAKNVSERPLGVER